MTITAPIILRHYTIEDQISEALSTVLLKGETVLIQNDDGTYSMRVGDGIHTIRQMIDGDIGLVTTYIPTQIDNDQLDKMIEDMITCENAPISGISSHTFLRDLARILLMMNNIRNYSIK